MAKLKLYLKNKDNRLVLTEVEATQKKRFTKTVKNIETKSIHKEEMVEYTYYHPFLEKECIGKINSIYFN